jgi:hypothetical protein
MATAEPPVQRYQCMNRLCARIYRHRATPWPELGGYVLAHSCPHCGSIYTAPIDYPLWKESHGNPKS